MKNIGITGQSGFIGTHLANTLNLFPEKYKIIHFEDDFFLHSSKLNNFVKKCDIVVHLAAMNRHHEPQTIYDTNIRLVTQLINSLEETQSKPHLIFSSSIQEDIDNLYGKSKKVGRELLSKWAKKNNAVYTGFIFPNIFGPFGQPYYNSFIATFCHQISHGETPVIEIDKTVPLLYISDVVKHIMKAIDNKTEQTTGTVPETYKSKVSEVLNLLLSFGELYLKMGIIPNLDNHFERNLFNTFICYMDIKSHFPVKLKLNTDNRGNFVETIKLNTGGQVSYSTTKPGITRGDHFHIRKAERFAVIKGKARINIRKTGTNEVINFYIDADENPAYVDMPVWYTHNITNIGESELFTLFWVNEIYNQNDPDTYYENVEPEKTK